MKRVRTLIPWLWLYAAANGVDGLPWGTTDNPVGYFQLAPIALALMFFASARARLHDHEQEAVNA